MPRRRRDVRPRGPAPGGLAACVAERPALRRGDVVYVHFATSVGCEINTVGKPDGRPAVVLGTDGPLLTVVPMRGAVAFRGLDSQVEVPAEELGLGGKRSVIECRQVHSVDPSRVTWSKGIWARLRPDRMRLVDAAVREAIGLT